MHDGYTMDISSDTDVIALDLSADDGAMDLPVLIDMRDKEDTIRIAKRIASMSASQSIEITGNIRTVDGVPFVAISSSDSYTISGDAGPITVDFYAINDFHGSTDRIASLATCLKGVKEEGAVLINSGDLWQGSLVSNSNRGAMLTRAMDEIGFDSFTLGNHEFDWGTDYIAKNKNLSDTPFLAANLYHWDAGTKTYGDFYSDLAEEYVVKDLDNGLRVGIIGVIGSGQITSITSSVVQDLGFKEPEEIVPDLAAKLREEEDCDLVVLSGHADETALMSDPIANSVDAVFCAHSHDLESSEYNGVPYIQGGSYGRYVSKVSITLENRKITARSATNISFSPSSYAQDATVLAMVEEAEKAVEGVADEKVASLSEGLAYKGGVDRLVAKAMALEAEEQGYAVDLAMTNQARSSLSAGDVAYESLFQALPFDNIVYIAEVAGADLFKEAKYNALYRLNGEAFENSEDVTYTVAVIDYLLLHQNAERDYDYFSGGFEIKGFLEKEGEEFYNYREITADYMRSQTSEIDASEFAASSARNSGALLGSSVTF